MKRLSLAIIIIALLLCGCEEGYSDEPPIETLTQAPNPKTTIAQKETPSSEWIKNTPASTPKEPEIDEIRDYIELGFGENEAFEPPLPELDSVDLNGDELYVEYVTDRSSETELFDEMHKVAGLIEEAFTGYQNPGRVTIKAIPPKQYNYETSLLWNEFVQLSSGDMPISEWSRNTARSG